MACAPHDHSGHAHGDAGTDTARKVLSSDGSYRVHDSSEPTPNPFHTTFALNSEVTRVDAANLSEAVRVEVDAGMPAQDHGMTTTPNSTVMADGTIHTANRLFHMEGIWEICVDVTENGSMEQAVFEVQAMP